MDIVSRLKLFLSQNGIANSQFADTCDIPRPTLSQLLNGRNKKVSDEIISKIHSAYPALNIMWLMFGDGDMYVPKANNFLNPSQDNLPENSLFGNDADKLVENSNSRQAQISFSSTDNPMVTDAPRRQSAESPFNAMMQNIARSAGKRQTSLAQQTGARQVLSIMVFYSDNSFETFVPGK